MEDKVEYSTLHIATQTHTTHTHIKLTGLMKAQGDKIKITENNPFYL